MLHQPGLARLRRWRAAGPGLRLPRPWPLRSGVRAPLQSPQAVARSLRPPARGAYPLARRAERLPLRRLPHRFVAGPSRQRPDDAQRRGRGPGANLGRRPPTQRALARHDHLRGPPQGVERAAPGPGRRGARHLHGARPSRDRRPPRQDRRHRRGAAADPGFRRRPFPGREGSAQLLGLLDPQLLLARTALLRRGRRLRPARRDQDAACRWHRGDPRRRLQPHLRGQPDRADLVVPRHRQQVVLQAGAGQSALLLGLHRLRQHARRRASARAAAGARQPSALGRVLPRRRLPLRSGAGPAALPLRRVGTGGLPSGDRAGSRPLAGQADRGGLGPGRGRLPRRRLPNRLGRLERPVP